MPNAKHRLVVDTNLWVSLLLTKDFSKFDPILFGQRVTLLFSQELLDEFVKVARRPKFRRYFTVNDLQKLLTGIGQKAEFITVKSVVDSCRDPKDNFLLALSQDGQATHLLTGDKDLLILRKYQQTEMESSPEPTFPPSVFLKAPFRQLTERWPCRARPIDR